MAAWPIKLTEGSKPGKKHPLAIDISSENKKAKKSAHEKERQPGGPLIKNGRMVVIGCRIMSLKML